MADVKKFGTMVTSPAFRKWAYGLALAVSAGLAMVGLIDQNWAAALNLVFSALFGMAILNTNTSVAVAEDKSPTGVVAGPDHPTLEPETPVTVKPVEGPVDATTPELPPFPNEEEGR